MMAPLAVRAAKRLQWSSAVNIVADGNSLFAKIGAGAPPTAGQRIPEQAITKFPLAGSGVTLTNCAISGQTWAFMRSNITDVTGAYVDGAKNVLLIWEDTNSITLGQSVADAWTTKASYIANVRAAKNWHAVVALTTLPRDVSTDTATNAALNAQLDQMDAKTWAEYRSIGIDRVVDVRRVGSPFRFATYATDEWTATQSYWAESTPGARVHINTAGATLIAQYVAEELARLPA